MAMIKKNKFPTGGPMGKTKQYTPRTRGEIRKKATESLPEGADAREAQMSGIYDDAREYANWWYGERATQDKYKSQLPADALQAMMDRLNKATYDTSRYGDKISKAPNAFKVNAQGAQRDAAIRSELMRPTLGGLASPEDGIFWTKRMNDGTIGHEGIGHIAGDMNNYIQGAVPYVPTRDELAGEEYNKYATQPNERNAQTWDFRYENRNLKDDNGNYYIDPNRQLTPEDMKQMREKGVRLPPQWKNNSDEDIIKLHNTIADTGSKGDDPFGTNMAAYGGNLFNLGGPAAPQWNIQQPNVGKLTSPVAAPTGGGGGGLLKGLAGGLGGMGGGMLSGISSGISGAISGGMSTGVGGAMQAIGGIASNIPGVGGLIGAGVNVLGGLVNRAFGSQINDEFVNETKENVTNQLETKIDDSSFDSVLEQQATNRGLDRVSRDQVGKDGWFSKKAKNLTNDLNKKIENANAALRMNTNNAFDNVKEQQSLDVLASYSAFGGPLYADGGDIHIKKANRGKFTEYCGGKVTSECIRRGKNSSSPAVRKRATFAQNARNWHADGGKLEKDAKYNEWVQQLPERLRDDSDYNLRGAYEAGYNAKGSEHLPTRDYRTGEILKKPWHPTFLIGLNEDAKMGYYPYNKNGKVYTDTWEGNKKADGGFLGTHGGDFSNGITIIGEGGTHEQNPYEGIQIGTDPQGKPNLVEEGEVIFNDYVFSNRLKVPKKDRKRLRLREGTFADAAEKLQKESAERPNDPISKRGLETSMGRLASIQERIRERKRAREGKNKFADGGSKEASTWMRYAPVAGSAAGVFSDAIGLTNKPDYTGAEIIGGALSNVKPVGARQINNKLTYKPLDTNYEINKLDANQAAQRRAITNTSGGNRATAMAGLLAANANYGNQMGDLHRNAEAYNMAQKQQVESFNRGTNQYNAEAQMKADTFNAQQAQQMNGLRLKQKGMQAQIYDTANARSSAARSANLTNLFDNLGGIGQENFSMNMINSNPALLYGIGKNGSVDYKKNKKKKGGRLTYGR